jgi:hypothetical protein
MCAPVEDCAAKSHDCTLLAVSWSLDDASMASLEVAKVLRQEQKRARIGYTRIIIMRRITKVSACIVVMCALQLVHVSIVHSKLTSVRLH